METNNKDIKAYRARRISVIVIVAIGVLIVFQGDSMDFFKRMFGLQKSTSLNSVLDKINSLRKPAIHLMPSENDSLTKLGGLPLVSSSFTWPIWNKQPLAFLAQIDLSGVPRNGELLKMLPPNGLLYFFYDKEQGTWGFDPNDKGSWRVLYEPTTSGLKAPSLPDGLAKEDLYPERYLCFKEILTYPDGLDDVISNLNLSDSDFDKYVELQSEPFGGLPTHQLFGYPMPIQNNDMDREAQLASNGVYCGSPEGFDSEKAEELENGRHQWIMLLQLDSDDDAGMMWGDAGKLYFWIKRSDLMEGVFDNIWMILQCG